jgi:hypothetical protein
VNARLASAAYWLASQAMRPPRRTYAVLRWPFARAWSWWSGLEPVERVLYRAVILLGIGFLLTPWPQLGLIVPGVLLALVFFGFSFTRPRNG